MVFVPTIMFHTLALLTTILLPIYKEDLEPTCIKRNELQLRVRKLVSG